MRNTFLPLYVCFLALLSSCANDPSSGFVSLPVSPTGNGEGYGEDYAPGTLICSNETFSVVILREEGNSVRLAFTQNGEDRQVDPFPTSSSGDSFTASGFDLNSQTGRLTALIDGVNHEEVLSCFTKE